MISVSAALFRNYRLPLILAVIVIILATLEPVSGRWLRFDRPAMSVGEWWRFLTTHIVHLSWPHALGNLGGLALSAYIAGPACSRLTALWFYLFSSLFISLGLYLFAPDLNYYVGLSGVLHGLLLFAAFRSPFYSLPVRAAFILLITVKVIWEQTPFYDDMALSSYIGGRVETRAHLFGLVSAYLWLSASWLQHKMKERSYGG